MNYTLARNIIIYDELSRILPAFNSAHIKTILLAGAALGATVYDNIGQRPMGDIDLLIRHQDRQTIGELLGALGYALDTARSDEAHYSKTIGEPAQPLCAKAGFTLHIDCHTDLRHYLDDRALAGVWNRARLMSVIPAKAGIQSLVLSPEDTLIYTAVDSAIYHGRINTNTINDLTRIIKHYDNSSIQPSPFAERRRSPDYFGVGEGRVRGINWQTVVQRIKSYRLETPLYILFDLCRKQGVPIPDEVVNSLTPRKRSLEYRLYTAILHPASCILRSRSEVPIISWYPSSYEDASRVSRFLFRPVARWELFMNSFFPSLRFIKQQYEQARYGVSLILYPIRVFSLLGRINKGLYHMLRSALNL